MPGTPTPSPISNGTDYVMSGADVTVEVGYFDSPAFDLAANLETLAKTTASRQNWEIVRGGLAPGEYPTYEGFYNDNKNMQGGLLHMIVVDHRVYLIATNTRSAPPDAVQKRMIDTFRITG
jgi:hypothetical protein